MAKKRGWEELLSEANVILDKAPVPDYEIWALVHDKVRTKDIAKRLNIPEAQVKKVIAPDMIGDGCHVGKSARERAVIGITEHAERWYEG